MSAPRPAAHCPTCQCAAPPDRRRRVPVALGEGLYARLLAAARARDCPLPVFIAETLEAQLVECSHGPARPRVALRGTLT